MSLFLSHHLSDRLSPRARETLELAEEITVLGLSDCYPERCYYFSEERCDRCRKLDGALTKLALMVDGPFA